MFRPEHPNPAKRHESFINLNGTWEFEFDNTLVGVEKRYFEREHLDGRIEVPFCPESKLSGIANTDFINGVWYRRDIDISKSDLFKTVLLTFGAVDYEATVYINGINVGGHVGGYTPFTFDITDKLKEGKNSLCVFAKDDIRHGIPRGKQCETLFSRGCNYTRTTGIWQTVYLEKLPKAYIENVKLTPDAVSCSVTAEVTTFGKGEVCVEVTFNGKTVGKASKVSDGVVIFDVPLSEKHLWNVGDGQLYDVKVTLGDDRFYTYFGLRTCGFEGKKFVINGKSVFLRTVLDQGFYEDGICTAPTAEDIEKDIILSQSLGFNGARPHMKVFEPLYFYYADKLGYLTYGEFPCWGLDMYDPKTLGIVAPAWIEELVRDYNHPSIIGWCPFNETHVHRFVLGGIAIHDNTIFNIWNITKTFDKTRHCIDTSGYVHQQYTDVYDEHCYEQNVKRFEEDLEDIASGFAQNRHNCCNTFNMKNKTEFNGQPLFMSEFGGAKWRGEKAEDGKASWGYGNDPQTQEEFISRFDGLCSAVMNNENFFGFCYTQLYDIEQEQNGLLYYDRTPKFAVEKFKAILDRKAKIEE